MKTRQLLVSVSLLGLVVFCSGCGSLIGHGMAPGTAYIGVCFDADAIAHGNILFIADLPFSAIADTVFLPIEAGRSWRPDPLEGWKLLGSIDRYHPKEAIASDVRTYISKRKFRSQVVDQNITFYQDAAGRHAARIRVLSERKHPDYILIYDSADIRRKVIKFVQGRGFPSRC